MSLPSFLVLLVFFIGPMLMAIGLSFTNWRGISLDIDFVGLKNYRSVLNASFFRQLVINTFYLLLLYVPLLNVIAIVLASLIHRMSRKLGAICKSAIFFPNLLAPVVIGFIWLILYQYQNGIINRILNDIGLTGLVNDWLGDKNLALPAISVTILWFALGYFIVIYTAGLTAIPDELYESAEIDGANRFQQFFSITIPMLAPSITICVILSTIGCIAVFELPLVMTKGGPGSFTRTFGLAIWDYAWVARQHGNALATAVIMAFIAMVIAISEWFVLRRREDIY